MKRFLLVTMVCGFLPAPGLHPFVQAAQVQDKAAERIKNLGGTYVADKGDPDGPVVLVSFESTKVKDADLALLKDLSEITHLDLTTTDISDAGLAHLEGLSKLQVLGLTRTNVTDAGLEHLKGCVHLQALFLRQTKVGDPGLASLKDFKNWSSSTLVGRG
jgi:hypothetical protein